MAMNGGLKVERIVGNNVVLAVDALTAVEYVLTGKGLGFGAKAGDLIQPGDPRIEKRYRLDEEVPMKQYRALVEDIDPQAVRISERVIESIKERIAAPVNPKVFFALPNHIQFAVYRLRNGMDIRYPFLEATKRDYPEAYAIAAEAAELISRHYGIDVPDDEIGFLTLHVRSAEGPRHEEAQG